MTPDPLIADILWSGGKTFLIALALTPIFRDIFRSYNLMDRPGARKVHIHPIPRVGGIPIAIAYGLWLLSALEWPLDESLAWKLLPGTAAIFAVGLIDDLYPLLPLAKLAGQIGAASITFFMGLRIESIGGVALPFWVMLPLTLFWLLLTMNALNLIDGLDGLCAGMGLFSTLTLIAVALLYNDLALAAAAIPLAAALLGFLFYNFNPATVFLGDSGALLIGYLLGCFGIVWSQKTAVLASIGVPLLSICIPLLDLSLSVVRRFLVSRPIFGADRGHIHHRLLDLGLTPRRAVIVLYLSAAVAAVVALLLSAPQTNRYWLVLLLLFAAFCSYAISRLRYPEFHAAAQVLARRGLRSAFGSRIPLEGVSDRMRIAMASDDWWEAIADLASQAGWSRISWRRPGGSQTRAFGSHGEFWSFEIDLPGDEAVAIEGPHSSAGRLVDLVSFAEIVKTTWRPEWPTRTAGERVA